MVLRRGFSVGSTHIEKQRGIGLEPVAVRMSDACVDELVQERTGRQAGAEPCLIVRGHVQHLVDKKLRIVGIIPAAQAQQKINLVNRREITRIGAAIFLAADAIGLEIGPHAIKEALGIEFVEEYLVVFEHVIQSRARIAKQERGSRI